MKKIAVLGFALLALSGCRMAPKLEAPGPGTWEFGKRLGLKNTNLNQGDIGKRGAKVNLDWPARVAVVRIEKKTNYLPVSQDDWDQRLRKSNVVESVTVLDGIGVEDLKSPTPGTEGPGTTRGVAPAKRRAGANGGGVHGGTSAMFGAERWFASASDSDLIFLYATQVTRDKYWNPWVFTYLSVVGIPFAPAQEQAARAISKGFLLDVKTGEVLETAGAVSTKYRSANPIIIMDPISSLEQQVVHEAELQLMDQLSTKLDEVHARTRPNRTK